MSADVATVVAKYVAESVDHVQWEWDDVAFAAASLACASKHGVLQDVSKSLWRLTDAYMDAPDGVFVGLTCYRAACSGKDLRPLAKLARIPWRVPIGQMTDALERNEEQVGKHCPIRFKNAVKVRKLSMLMLNKSDITRDVFIPSAVVTRSDAHSKGTAHGGTMYRWRCIRGLLRSQPQLKDAVEKLRLRVFDLKGQLKAQKRAEEEASARAARAREQREKVDVAIREAFGPGSHEWLKHCYLEGKTEEQAVAAAARTKGLWDALRAKRLELRRNSRVCSDYLAGRRDDMAEVVNIMEEMDWYFKNTRYGRYMRRQHEDYRDLRWDAIRDGYESDEYGAFDPIDASRRAKLMALRHVHGQGRRFAYLPERVAHFAQANGIQL